eukprot:4279935-Pyramimonas_sp.AAC.1
MEATSRLPHPAQVLLTSLLPKPAGGHRPIGLFSALHRLWARARRPYAERWEAEQQRLYLASG